jgi:hypothetical protein
MWKLNLSEMEALARNATRAALGAYTPLTEEEKKELTLGSSLSDIEGVFELYLAKDKPQNAKLVSCAKVDRFAGEVQLEIFLQPLKV